MRVGRAFAAIPRVACALCAVLLLAAGNAEAQSAPDLSAAFTEANRLYEEGRYREAIQAYQGIESDAPFAALHFNLGNAFYQSGQPGQAIAEYRLAAALAPRDRDVAANLRFVRDTVSGPTWEPHWTERRVQRLTPGEWRTGTTVTLWLLFALLIAGHIRTAWRPALQRPVIVSAVLAAGLVAVTLWNDYGLGLRRFVVVIEPETVVRLGPFEGSAESMKLKDGAELLVVDEKDDWLQVTADGRASGWVRAEVTRPLR